MLADRFRLRRSLQSIRRARKAGKPFDRNLDKARQQFEASVTLREERAAVAPALEFPPELPITERVDEIRDAIESHQVIVVCGETGSGKSTQLPKIALAAGRGIVGSIGHTQPRRIAARSIASRLSEELKSPLGDAVGFRIRFDDKTKPQTLIKLMTDGILLAETQSDRFLENYDTIILDEAHERSLNIDFLIGYLKRLLPKRPTIKVIITSATLDPERFRDHFSTPESEVPIIEVSGRTFPVEVRYRSLVAEDDESQDLNWQQGLVAAMDEVASDTPGDVLVFLPTERDIRDAAKVLRGAQGGFDARYEVLPLYGRLSAQDQTRVFKRGKNRRIVLATNVAESSLTVPGIRYVIDTGTARISRYSVRSRMQRLPVEPVSQASANQRMGRCGRIGPGVCIRLYGEADFNARDEFTAPEIQRTNLAAVVLQSMSLKLGPIDEFPFIDPPKPTAVRDGFRTLFELGAIDDERQITDVGKELSRLPVDPRIGRMILAAADEGCLADVLVIAAALEIQDPRERPVEKREAADQSHEKFQHEQSDFVGLLKLWDFFHNLKDTLSQNRLRKAAHRNFLSYNRMREWIEIHRQLRDLAIRSSSKTLSLAAKKARRKLDAEVDYDAVHRSLLTGLLSNVAFREAENEYTGASGIKLFIWPGSGTFKDRPKWTVAAELVETTRRYARTVARINPDWIEPIAGHLLKRNWTEPHWSRRNETAMAYENATLFGLPVVNRRRGRYGDIDPAAAREFFLREGLVEGELRNKPEFLKHNESVLAEAESLQARSRRRDFLSSEELRYEFYNDRIPEKVVDAASLRKWLKRRKGRGGDEVLRMKLEDLVDDETESVSETEFPREMIVGEAIVPLDYQLKPGADNDGITLTVERDQLAGLDRQRLGWLVPGLIEEKVVALIRNLPKDLRRSLVPAPDTAKEVLQKLTYGEGDFETELARELTRIAGDQVPPELLDEARLPNHLRMNVRVVDDSGEEIASDRSVEQLAVEVPAPRVIVLPVMFEHPDWRAERSPIWKFGTLPETVEIEFEGKTVDAWPGLLDTEGAAAARLFASTHAAAANTEQALVRLVVHNERRRLKGAIRQLPRLNQLEVLMSSRKGFNLRSEIINLLARLAYVHKQPLPRSAAAFEKRLEAGRDRLAESIQDVASLVSPLFGWLHKSTVALDKRRGNLWNDNLADIDSQLESLLGGDFLLATPWAWLCQFPRYLSAISHRIDRLNSDFRGDTQRLKSTHDLQQSYDELVTENPVLAFEPSVVRYRWMLEEFRVSLFAQKLGTAVPVSEKLLREQAEKMVAVVPSTER